LTSYCEDCLPQDEIEGIGRHRAYEELGFASKQAYFIKCPSCCSQDGVEAQGICGDADAEAKYDVNSQLFTQTLRLFPTRIEDKLDVQYLEEQEAIKRAEEAKKLAKKVALN
jgi:hypothetical protein